MNAPLIHFIDQRDEVKLVDVAVEASPGSRSILQESGSAKGAHASIQILHHEENKCHECGRSHDRLSP